MCSVHIHMYVNCIFLCLSLMYAMFNTAIGSKALLRAARLPDSVLGRRCCHNRFTQQSQICVHSDLQQVLEHNLSLLIKSYQTKVINELVVYGCV